MCFLACLVFVMCNEGCGKVVKVNGKVSRGRGRRKGERKELCSGGGCNNCSE